MDYEEVEEWRVVRYLRPRQNTGDMSGVIFVVVLFAIFLFLCLAVYICETMADGKDAQRRTPPISKPVYKASPTYRSEGGGPPP